MERNSAIYGVPQQKKFPLPDADHVRSAIKFFNYVEPKYEAQLAKAIIARAKTYGVDLSEMSIGDENRFKKYLVNDELKHYGIKGQKWGVRRWQNDDGSFNAEGKLRYFGKVGSARIKSTHATKDISGKKFKKSENTTVEKQKMGIVPKENKLSTNATQILASIGVGLSLTNSYLRDINSLDDLTDKDVLIGLGTTFVAGTLAAYGVSKAIDYVHDKKSIYFTDKAYPEYQKQNSERIEAHPKEYNSEGVRLKQNECSISDDIKAVNPKYNQKKSDGMNTNCVLCSAVYDLRRRGYDVTAPAAFGKASTDVKAWYKDAKQYNVKFSITGNVKSLLGLDARKRAFNQLTEDLLKQGEGARGNVMGVYQFGGYSMGGHSIAYEIKDNAVHYIDCQIGKEYETPYNDLFQYYGSNTLTYIRTDNCEPDFEAMKKNGVFLNRV